jgi:two-component system, chemotaxis family, sensor kinase CheA
MIDDYKQIFIEEASDLLTDLEISLLDLERRPSDAGLVAKVFRALHTIKGSSGMFGYPDISEFTHNIETIFHHIRNGNIQITKGIIDLTLLAHDQISIMLVSEKNNNEHKVNLEKEILTELRKYIPGYN